MKDLQVVKDLTIHDVKPPSDESISQSKPDPGLGLVSAPRKYPCPAWTVFLFCRIRNMWLLQEATGLQDSECVDSKCVHLCLDCLSARPPSSELGST